MPGSRGTRYYSNVAFLFHAYHKITSSTSMRATINGYTAWANARLVREGCEADNILLEIMVGTKMKVLLHCTLVDGS